MRTTADKIHDILRYGLLTLLVAVATFGLASLALSSPQLPPGGIKPYPPPPVVTPNDALYFGQLGLHAGTPNGLNGPGAWAITTGNPLIVVAVVDSGVYPGHEDLVQNVLPGIDLWQPGMGAVDTNGHGTAMASIIAATTNNTLGCAGVTWQCRVVPIKVSPFGMTVTQARAGLDAARTQTAARVALVSSSCWSTLYTGNQQWNQALSRFQSDNGLVVCPSGNGGGDAGPIANDPDLIVCGSVGADGVRAVNSIYGGMVDIVASNGAVHATIGGGYANTGGTSNAAPMVAGTLALMLSVRPNLTNAQARTALLSTATDLGPPGWDPEYGWGLVNAGAAVQAALAYP